MKKILKILSLSVLVLTFLCLFAYSVKDASRGGRKLGPLSGPLDQFASLPKTFKEVLGSPELRGISLTCTAIDPAFQRENEIDYPVYGLHSYFKENRWNIVLYDFREDSALYLWTLKGDSYVKETDRQFANSRPKNPVLLPDRSLIAMNSESYNLYRLDRESRIVWQNSSTYFHHSLNLDENGDIWACTSSQRGFRHTNKQKEVYFRDEFITRIDVETGEILFNKSISEMLIENGYSYLVYGYSNRDEQGKDDPLHLNDIEPVLKNGPYWEKGDVFISLRHRSLIIQYRPHSNELVRFIQGPFFNQHDVDILSDYEIALFNNNTTSLGQELGDDAPGGDFAEELTGSDIVVYDLRDSTFSKYLNDQFEAERIFTRTEGLFTILSNGDVFVESSNEAKIYILSEHGTLLRKQFDAPGKELVYGPNWTRIYEAINF